LSNVTILRQAISDVVGEVPLQVFPDGGDVYNSLGAALRPIEGLHATSTLQVQATTLDACAEQLGIQEVDFLKVDIEGAEERAISGAEKLLKRSRNVHILAELYQPSAAQCGCDVDRLVMRLRDWGFRMFDITSRGRLLEVQGSKPAATYAVFKRSET
jgi:FkbM family methyltransferase